MNLVTINASPKPSGGASEKIIEDFCTVYNKPQSITRATIHSGTPSPELYSAFSTLRREGGAALFVFPLYLDGLPSHLLHALCSLAEHACFDEYNLASFTTVYTPKIYVAVNCAYFEGIHAETAIEIMKNWSARAGCEFGGGIGLGGCAGYGIREMPAGLDGKHRIKKQLSLLADTIKKGDSFEPKFTSIGYPKHLYRIGTEVGLRALARRNNVNL